MSFLWDALKESVKDTAGRVGSATAAAGQKAKLKTELLLIEREITAREQTFGVELYDYVAPLSKHPSFYSSDDTLTKTLQPPLITAQREIAALEIKCGKQQEKINQATVTRAASYKPATNWQETVVNLGKSTAHAGSDTILGTEMAMLRSQIKAFKQEFGVTLYTTLEELEDTKQWLPTDREIRSIYDNCRRDVEKIKKRKQAKEQELAQIDGLDGSGGKNYDGPTSAGQIPQPSIYANSTTAQPSMYANSVTESIPSPPQPSASEFYPPTATQHPSYGSSQPATASFNSSEPSRDPFGSLSHAQKTQQQQPQMQNDPFISSMAQQKQQQQRHDPFSGGAEPTPQQSLQNGLFAGIVPPQQQQPYGNYPSSNQIPQSSSAASNNQFQQHQQPQSQYHDPFAAAPPPQTVAFDAFAATAAATTTTNTATSSSLPNNHNTYDDPFAGL